MKTERTSPNDKAILREKLVQQVLPASGLLLIYGVFFYAGTWACWLLGWIQKTDVMTAVIVETILIVGIVGYTLRKFYFDYSAEVKYTAIMTVTNKKVNHRDIVSEDIYPAGFTGLSPERDELYLEFDNITHEVTLDEFNSCGVGDEVCLSVGYSTKTTFKVSKLNFGETNQFRN